MKKIGGNIAAQYQTMTGTTKNEIGESVPQWATVADLWGWLDYASGEAGYQNWGAKAAETTHVFVCDFQALPLGDARLICNEKTFDVLNVDNPMELNYQLEISLKYTGALNG